VIELRDVTLRIGARTLLDGVDARIAPGEFTAVLGPNGIGKTTLLRTIGGLHETSKGEVRVDGFPVATLSPVERAKRIAFVTGDEVFLDALRVRDVVAIGRFPHHRWWQWRQRDDDTDAVDRALAAVHADAFAERLFATLSSGERQRIWIALGLAQETPVLLLDEPTTHLDVRVAHDILALLRRLAREGHTVVCALHDLNDAAAYADRIALLGEGRLLAFDTPHAVLSSDLIEAVYGIGMERVTLGDGRLRVFPR
jgi:iron complex transport system ATP-binding protein